MSNIMGFLIYAIKHYMPIDTVSIILSFMNREPKRSKLPYSMALTRLFRNAGVDFSGEDVIMPTGQGFSIRSLSQARMTFNSSKKEWTWNGQVVASASIDPMSVDPTVFTDIYGSEAIVIGKKGRAPKPTEADPSRGRKRARTSDPLAASPETATVGPSSSNCQKKSLIATMLTL